MPKLDRYIVRYHEGTGKNDDYDCYEIVDNMTGEVVDGWSDPKYANKDCARRNRTTAE